MRALSTLVAAGLTVRAKQQEIFVSPRSLLNDELRRLIRERMDEILAELGEAVAQGAGQRERPYRLSKEAADRAHWRPWDDAVISRFDAWVRSLMVRGLDLIDAEDLAEALVLCDRDADDRHLDLGCMRLIARRRAAAREDVLGGN